jgi:hypothetical protein
MLNVKGYTDQEDSKVELVNRMKEVEEIILRRLDAMHEANLHHPEGAGPYDSYALAIGRRDIMAGFMWINRSIFKPERVKLEGE